MLRDGHSTDECEAYLVQVAVVYMGMGLNRDGTIRPDREQTFRELATPTVAAIRAYAAELDANLDPPLSDTAQKS